MGKCVFKTSEVKRCVEHALAAADFRMAFSSSPPGPGILFVHDQGVYIMSNGLPMDEIKKPDGKPHSYVAYAEDCNPDKDENWWENSRDLVGGDDFGEVFLVNKKWLEDLDAYEELEIEVTPEQLELYFAKPRKATAAT